jgi:protein TonB
VLLAPYYRSYELPWEGDPDSSEQYRKILRILLIIFVVFAILFAVLPTPKKTHMEETVPPRLARVMIASQPKPPPPPPPAPVEQPKPKPEPEKPKVAAVTPPPVDRQQQAREKAQKQLNQVKDELADLREQLDMTQLAQTKNLSGAVGADSHAERNLITSKVGAGSGGITTSNMGSRGFGTGAGSLTGHDTGAVASGIAQSGLNARGAQRTGNSGKAARSREEIELIFDRNKGAIYSLYSRALRDTPELQGKMVLEFTISPTGEVTMCRVVSSELNDPELEKKIVARVRLFRFEARDVETITTTKPIDFFPA